MGGCLPQCMLGYTHPPSRQTPPLDLADTPQTWQTPPGPGRHTPTPRTWQTPPRPGRHTPPDQADPSSQTWQTPPPRPGRHPPQEADSRTRSTSGRYASYWNAFLLSSVVGVPSGESWIRVHTHTLNEDNVIRNNGENVKTINLKRKFKHIKIYF